MSEVSYPEVDKWLTGKAKGTKYIYRCALDAYVEFTGLNPTQLIDEAEADREKSTRERGAPELRIKKFKEWLLTKYRQKRRGTKTKDKPRIDKIGVSETLARMYCGAVKTFYKANGFPLDVKLGKARKKKANLKLVIRRPEISKLLSVATSLRDKAIVKFMYESCQGASEVCSPNYGDIKQYEEDGMEIWQIHLIRKKTGTEYYTEIGPETIELLKLYFAERERSGEKLNSLSPVFVKEGRKKSTRQRITPNLIENMFKTLAIKSGLVTEEQMQLADLNPARPHSLRSGGMSVLKLAGYNPEAVEFRAGHELTEQRQLYWLARPEELRELFRKHYNALRVHTGPPQIDEERIKKLEDMLAEREITVHALRENGRLKVAELERLRKELDQQRVKIEGLTRTVAGLSNFMESKVEEITRRLWKEELSKQYEADREAIKELQKWREEFTKRYAEEVKKPSPKPKLEPKPKQREEEEPSIDIWVLLQEETKQKEKQK